MIMKVMFQKLKIHDSIDSIEIHNKLVHNTSSPDSMVEFTNELIKYFELNISSIFKKKKDLNIAYAILEILKKREDIENFNKKAIYILIREMADVNTANITSVVNVFKQKYLKLSNEFYTKGYINMSNKKKFF